MSDFARRRNEMVDRQIAARGVRSPAVLDAMRSIPREEFVPGHVREFAYDDSPLPIGHDQTISQPYIVAFMAEALALEGGENVLDIGTGSGYAAAVLSLLAAHVYTIERIADLADRAREALARAGRDNVTVVCGDGTRGLPEHAPFDAIVVAAGSPAVPESLKRQLAIAGRLVIPVGTSRSIQELVRVTRVSEDGFDVENLAGVRFVPLIGSEGWESGGNGEDGTGRR